MRSITTLIAFVALTTLSACSSNSNYAQQQRHAPVVVNASHPATSIASQMLGTPYRFGGATPRGFDCSGLVYYSYSRAGYSVPRTSQLQYQQSLPVMRSHMKEGDLLFFRIDGKVSHVGVYIGDNRFIHAPSSGKRVSIASLDEPYWKQRFTKAGRFF